MTLRGKYLPNSSLVQAASLPVPSLLSADITSLSPSKTKKLFFVPATLSITDSAYIFTLLHQGVEQQAVLHQTFLTALELDGNSFPWEQVRQVLVPGIKARVDITQVRHSSTEHGWLVFGLYLDTAIMRQTDQVTVGVKDGFNSSDLMETREEDKVLSDGSLSSQLSWQSGSEDEYLRQCLNQTFTVDEEPSLHDQVRCDHKYEVGVVVVTISSQFLHLIVQCGDTWSRADVDPLDSLVFVEGIRTKEVFSIKMGAMGHMVTKKCVKCQVDKTSAVDLSPILLWFGEKRCPSVREQPGVVGGWEGNRVVVQMGDSETMVLFHGEIIMEDLGISTNVLVWAWSKMLRGGVGSFLEGAAVVVQEDTAGEVVGDDTYDMLEFSTDGIFSPIRSKFDEADDDLLNLSSTDHMDAIDVSLSVSFGSVSGQSDDGKENFSMMVNPDCSSNYMEDISLRDNVKKDANDFLDEIYFQSLFWRSSSPKPDAIIDAQFNNILSANDLLHNYDDLVTDYDQMNSADTSSKFQADLCSRSLSLTPENQEPAPVLPAFITMSKSFTRSLSHTPLSPIPEETPADREASDQVDDPVLAAAWPGAASTPAGRLFTDQERSPLTPYRHHQLPTAMDSGYYDSFSSGLNTNGLSGDVKFTRVILEQFLEFTKFPEGERPAIIDSFLAYTDVEEI